MNLRIHRMLRGLTQWDLGLKLDRSQPQISLIQTSLFRTNKQPFFLTRIISAGSCPLQQRATCRLALVLLNRLIFGKAVPEPPGGYIVQEAQGAP